MARTRTPKTAEERKADAEGLHALLLKEVDALKTSDGWLAYLTMAAKFHTYSRNNQFLIMIQCSHATKVAGYRTWQSLGQQVKKGEKAIRIYGFAKWKKETERADGTLHAEDRIYFPVVSVFDVSQTEPMEGQKPFSMEGGPTVLDDQDDDGLASILLERLQGEGFTIRYAPTGSSALAYVTPEWKITVSPDLSPAMTVHALLHEAAHAYLGHVAGGYNHHRGLAEVEADSVAYVVAGMLGSDSSGWTVSYITEWATSDGTEIQKTADRVVKVAAAVHALVVDGAAPERLTFDPSETSCSLAA